MNSVKIVVDAVPAACLGVIIVVIGIAVYKCR